MGGAGTHGWGVGGRGPNGYAYGYACGHAYGYGYAKMLFFSLILYVCIICMYYMYVKLRGQSRPPGGKNPQKHNLRIQGRMHFFEKMSQMALNRVLTLPDCRSRSQLPESGLRSQKGPLGAEL